MHDWRTNPFEPHRIANYRTVAYQKTVVMKYLDNLISWGDYLFRQDSMESINEATQLYVLAAEILGQRPKKIAPQVKPRSKASTRSSRSSTPSQMHWGSREHDPAAVRALGCRSRSRPAADAVLLHPRQ